MVRAVRQHAHAFPGDQILVWLTGLFVGLVGVMGCTALLTPPAQPSTIPSLRQIEEPAVAPGQAHSGELPTAPMLRLETEMHTAQIRQISVDGANRYLATASHDKTARVWDLATGHLLRVLRPPIGAGQEGRLVAVALSPDGRTVAVGGWTGLTWDGAASIYLFDRGSGQLLQRLTGLPYGISALSYARDGQFLVALLLVKGGMRVYRTRDYAEVARDETYGDGAYGADFDADGRLVTTSWDGFVRLYTQAFRLQTKRQPPGGKRPARVAFTPDGTRLAVGYDDSTRVDVLSGQDLTPLYAPNTSGVVGNFASVAWAADGHELYAGGKSFVGNTAVIRRWGHGSQGEYTEWPVAQNTILYLLALKDRRVVFGAADPAFGVLDDAGQWRVSQKSMGGDLRATYDGFRLSSDGTTVQFSYEPRGTAPAHFAMLKRALTQGPATDEILAAPLTSAPGLAITDWKNTGMPKLNGSLLKLQPYETSRSLAITPDRQRFLLGTEWYLRFFDRQGTELWKVPVPSSVGSVNIAGTGHVAIAALTDGTIRWYRLGDGQELLAFFPHRDRKRWVLWTPAGYYDASPGAEDFVGWHVNRGSAQEADFFPVGQFRAASFRPDVVAQVLTTLDVAEALRRANAETNRPQDTLALTQRLPPVVQILAPGDDALVSMPRVTLRVTVRAPSGEPVTALKTLIDGRPVAETRAPQIVPDPEAIHELHIPVPPRDVEVMVLAENRYTSSTPATVRLRWGGVAPEAFVIKPQLYVLAIGVSAYQMPDLRLDFAAQDAQALAAVLQRQHGRLYREVHVKLLTDAQASKEGIQQGLEWLERQTTQHDVAVIFLAGHGVNDRNGDYYFLPVHAQLEHLRSSGLPFSDLKNTIAALPGKVLFFIDTCHAGNVWGRRRGATDITAIVNELISAENGAVVFAASTGNQFSLEDLTWGHGVFTQALVEGLSGKADYGETGRITVNMLDLYLSERVKELTRGQQTPTTVKPHSIPDFPVAVVQ